MTKYRVGFVGPMRAGKDTAGAIFDTWVRQYSDSALGVFRYTLAGSLKDAAKNIWGESPTRHQYQTLGLSLRDANEDVWVEQVIRKIKKDEWAHMNEAPIYIPDVRFENEITRLDALDFKFVGILSTYQDRFKRTDEAGKKTFAIDDQAESEREAYRMLEYCDAVAANNNLCDGFEDQLISIFENLWVGE